MDALLGEVMLPPPVVLLAMPPRVRKRVLPNMGAYCVALSKRLHIATPTEEEATMLAIESVKRWQAQVFKEA